MNKNKINVYISSKNYNKPNDFEVSFPTSLIKCDPKTEYIVLNVNGWIMKNEFYNKILFLFCHLHYHDFDCGVSTLGVQN